MYLLLEKDPRQPTNASNVMKEPNMLVRKVRNMMYSLVLVEVPIASKITLEGTNRIHKLKDSNKTPTTWKKS